MEEQYYAVFILIFTQTDTISDISIIYAITSKKDLAKGYNTVT